MRWVQTLAPVAKLLLAWSAFLDAVIVGASGPPGVARRGRYLARLCEVQGNVALRVSLPPIPLIEGSFCVYTHAGFFCASTRADMTHAEQKFILNVTRVTYRPARRVLL